MSEHDDFDADDYGGDDGIETYTVDPRLLGDCSGASAAQQTAQESTGTQDDGGQTNRPTLPPPMTREEMDARIAAGETRENVLGEQMMRKAAQAGALIIHEPEGEPEPAPVPLSVEDVDRLTEAGMERDDAIREWWRSRVAAGNRVAEGRGTEADESVIAVEVEWTDDLDTIDRKNEERLRRAAEAEAARERAAIQRRQQAASDVRGTASPERAQGQAQGDVRERPGKVSVADAQAMVAAGARREDAFSAWWNSEVEEARGRSSA